MRSTGMRVADSCAGACCCAVRLHLVIWPCFDGLALSKLVHAHLAQKTVHIMTSFALKHMEPTLQC